jgi:AcrR family transcriptional regulator
MGTSERKERERAEMRDAILNAATEMFLKDGFEKTSIRGIAEKIEYSVGTIYLYFKDKTELLNVLMEQGFQKMTIVFRNIKQEEDPMARLRLLAHTYVNFAFENKEYYDLMFIMRKPMEIEDEKKYASSKKAFEFLKQTVAACIDQKRLRFQDRYSATLSMWGFVHGLVALNSRTRLGMFKEDKIEKDIHDAVDNFVDAVTM